MRIAVAVLLLFSIGCHAPKAKYAHKVKPCPYGDGIYFKHASTGTDRCPFCKRPIVMRPDSELPKLDIYPPKRVFFANVPVGAAFSYGGDNYLKTSDKCFTYTQFGPSFSATPFDNAIGPTGLPAHFEADTRVDFIPAPPIVNTNNLPLHMRPPPINPSLPPQYR